MLNLENLFEVIISHGGHQLKHNGPAIKVVCGAESNGGGDSVLAMMIIPQEPQ
jgi:hypothetical protein